MRQTQEQTLLENLSNPETEGGLIYEGSSIRIYGFPQEHVELTDSHVESFRQVVEKINPAFLVPEYASFDIRDKFMSDMLKFSNPYAFDEFELLLKTSGVEGKTICLDPAHNDGYVYLDASLVAPTTLATGFLFAEAVLKFTNALSLDKQSSRRDFLKGVAKSAGFLGSALVIPDKLKEIFLNIPINVSVTNPQALRRCVAARNIIRLDEKLQKLNRKEKINLLLMYPPVHLRGIKDYLDSPETTLLQGDFFANISDFGCARIYSKKEENWVQTSKIKL